MNDFALRFSANTVKQAEESRRDGGTESEDGDVQCCVSHCTAAVLIGGTICSVSATLSHPDAAAAPLGSTTALKMFCCGTCYYSPRATLSSSASRLRVQLKFPSFCIVSVFFFLPANWSDRLNRLNLSPIIKSDYKNFREAPSRLAGDYTAGGSLTYTFSSCSIFSSVG